MNKKIYDNLVESSNEIKKLKAEIELEKNNSFIQE